MSQPVFCPRLRLIACGYALLVPSAIASLQLEEVIVTGEKSGRSVLETVNSVQILTATQLLDRGVLDLKSAVRRIPGVTEVGNNQGYAIRGVQLFGATGAGSRFSSTINVLVDGVSQDRFSQRINPFDSWDVRQIEVFKGGQSINLGMSSLAGAIVVDTFDPVRETEYALEGRVGSDSARGLLFMANTLLSDTTAIRLSGGNTQDDGWVYNPTLDDDADPASNDFLRFKLLYEPGPRFRALTLVNVDEAQTGDDFVDADFPFEREVFSNLRADEDNERLAISQQLDYSFSDHWHGDAIFSVQDATYFRSDDADREDFDGGRLFRDEDTRTYSLESRLRYSGDGLNGFIGVHGFLRQSDEYFGSENFDLGPLLGLPLGSLVLNFEGPVAEDREIYALFGEVDYDLSPQWSVRLAARIEHVRSDLSQSQESTLPALAPSGADQDSDSFTEFLPFAAVTYRLSDDANLSLFYKESYRTGGVEVDLANARTNAFDPEFTQSLELAYRASLGRTNIEANAYYTDWKDQQVTSNPSGLAGLEVTANAGSSVKYGVELSIEWFVHDALNVYFSGNLARTEFKDFDENPFEPGDFDGNEFPLAPREAFNAGLTWRFLPQWSLDVNANYQDGSFVDSANTVENDSYMLYNTTLNYDNESWYAGLSVTNLSDENYITRNNAPPSAIQIGDPRLWLLKFGVRF